ncbi:aminotransferase class III-fold pyridoxal phosphate-dependent enzyme [Veronia pacifica]|uniref:Glutamate-1-semialdehyde aminotransferase n=1 Tax=Veronia pacifica TaxID=1080227 RepID=A0A1C3EJY5_9GAMM|nr:aminotransferase class III-fold pyridoxal phosphate-dependent enzyme [Veronia pacifica]ODA33540.1 glutamate-1-semialdehyde aminotransferase [Veronia pacifica]
MTTHTSQTLNLTESLSLHQEGEKYIAGFTQSMMKKPEQFAKGHFPVYLAKGQGSKVTDVDGNEYIDFICGLAANTLGHNHPAVVNAITENLTNGLIHSLPAPVEIKTAKNLISIIPGAEKVRFFKTGADANSAAIRLTRHLTGREEIVTIGYNGWHDQYQFDTPGVPEGIQKYTHRMPLFTPMDEPKILELLESRGDKIAAVLMSVPYNRTLTADFVKTVRQHCSDKGIYLVFDEVVTGFRLALGGAQEFFGVQADLVTLSKGIAAGMPLSAVAGPSDTLSRMDELQVSTTFGGEMLSLEVCNAVIDEYKRTDYIERIAKLGRILKEEVNAISASLGTPLNVVGYDPIPMFLFAKNPVEHVKYAEPFLAEMAKRGVLMRREVNFISGAHTEEDINVAIQAVKASLEAMKANGLFENAAK